MIRLVLLLFAAPCLFGQPLANGLYAIFHTSMGDITARLYEKDASNTVANFVALAQGTEATLDPKTHKMAKVRLYDNITFHRVLPGVMIQSGDPTGTGTHNCGFTIHDEVLPGLRFDASGKLAMANTGEPDSGSCQFFITANPMPEWNGKYTIFGTVVEGKDVVSAIAHGRVHGDKPVEPVKLINVVIERVGPAPAKKKRKP